MTAPLPRDVLHARPSTTARASRMARRQSVQPIVAPDVRRSPSVMRPDTFRVWADLDLDTLRAMHRGSTRCGLTLDEYAGKLLTRMMTGLRAVRDEGRRR